MSWLAVGIFLWNWLGHSMPPPAQPQNVDHPGSNHYLYELDAQSFVALDRKVEVWLPKGGTNRPLLVFAKGMLTSSENYRETFEHLARKGLAVAFIPYEKSFFDFDWERMAKDFVLLTKATLEQYPEGIHREQVVFSGHSKGAWVAMMAAGLPESEQVVDPNAVVIFAPAGVNAEYLKRVNSETPVTIFWGEQDGTTSDEVPQDILENASSNYKQFIRVVSYPTEPRVEANHEFPLTKGTFLGGGPEGPTALHYFGVWKWLLGAAEDVENGGQKTNPYLYGEKALTTAIDGIEHSIQKIIH